MKTLDALITEVDNTLRTVSGNNHASRPSPGRALSSAALDPQARQLAGALMRVNHVGEVCAQALYRAQAISTRDPALRRQFENAAREETDHLAWTRERIDQLGARPSLLNPLWYTGAYLIGLAAGRAGDAPSLGFLVETERQVEQHLAGHLDRLPLADTASRAIVAQMKSDEARHAAEAEASGATRIPAPLRWLMRAAAKVMTTTAQRI